MNRIDKTVIENVCALAKLSLTEEEQEKAGEEMRKMAEFAEMLNELDTEGTEPMFQVFPAVNVYREDFVENGDCRGELLENAPRQRDGQYQVPKTVEQGGT